MKNVFISLLITLAAINVKAETAVTAQLKLNSVTPNMTSLNARFYSVASAQVTFNQKNLELTVERHMPRCAPNMMCMMVMPAPVTVRLEVVQIIETGCSVKYIAQTPADAPKNVFEEIIVEDFSSTKCEMALSATGFITYKITGESTQTKLADTATAIFSVQGQFNRETN